MKLDCFEMNDAFDRSDWGEAIAITQRHFGITLPSKLLTQEMGIYKNPVFSRMIRIESKYERSAWHVYEWWEDAGFKVATVRIICNLGPSIRIWTRPLCSRRVGGAKEVE